MVGQSIILLFGMSVIQPVVENDETQPAGAVGLEERDVHADADIVFADGITQHITNIYIM